MAYLDVFSGKAGSSKLYVSSYLQHCTLEVENKV